jgi:hypothetical protein
MCAGGKLIEEHTTLTLRMASDKIMLCACMSLCVCLCAGAGAGARARVSWVAENQICYCCSKEFHKDWLWNFFVWKRSLRGGGGGGGWEQFKGFFNWLTILWVKKDFVPWGKMSVSDVFLDAKFKYVYRISLSPTRFVLHQTVWRHKPTYVSHRRPVGGSLDIL